MGRIENLPHSYKMHSSMCLELKKLVDRIMRIFPDIEDARPGCSSGIQTLCLLNKSLEKAKLLLQYCNESSKLYTAVTGDAILSRGVRAKKSLEQSLIEIRTMVPTVLAIKISQIVQDVRSTELSLESSEEEAGKAIRELMRRSTSSSVSSDEIRDFHSAAIKLQLITPEAIVIERRSLKSLYTKLGECEGNKRQILKYLLCLLKKHERIICRDHKENSFSLHVNAAEAGCSEERNGLLPEQFKCPLSLTVMYDPVIISSGHTFERVWIQKWFDGGNESCPKSKTRLDDLTLNPNVAMKEQISKWCSKHGLDVQDPATKHTAKEAMMMHSIDYSVSIASFGSSLCNIPDLSCFSSRDFSSSFSHMSKSGYFMPMQTIKSESGTVTTASSPSRSGEMVMEEPLCELTNLPLDAQVKLIEDVRSRFAHNAKAFRFMSPSKFLEPLITYLKNAHERYGTTGEIVKGGLVLLLSFVSGNRKAIESLEEDVFKTLSVFLESEVVAEESLNVFEVISNHSHHGLSKIASSGALSSLLKIVESRAEHLHEQAMMTLKNLSSSSEICLEMVSLGFVEKLTSFLQQNVFSKQSIVVLRNLCNTEKGRVCVTETPGCLASISDLLDSDVSEEQENAISILLQLCVQKMEYCDIVVREGTNIYSSLLLISKNGTEEAKNGASELLRALEEVDAVDRGEEEEVESSRPEEEETAATSSQVVTSVTYEEPIITTTPPSTKKSGIFGFGFSSLKKKKSR
ncbi:unnamed protein product [Microthlaspi erraticum]|uniref:RING-type E3 ubiquitin transferase n=1 Tax=Microthlaspi erraticum TaxID=1685480 RepID=A0A6D2J728_9BRAS|nr:unnamed protein product [Microthlaspi erraticum]